VLHHVVTATRRIDIPRDLVLAERLCSRDLRDRRTARLV
jgi:hypothetical protein